MNITITGIKELQDYLDDKIKNQIPYALKTALNQTASDIKTDEQNEMKSVFDRPTPFTLNSIGIIAAKKDYPVVEIFIKESARLADKEHYLVPEIQGGDRSLKGIERALYKFGILQKGMYVVPARDAWLDQYGNVPGSEITKIMSAVQLFNEMGYQMNQTKKSRGRKTNHYFIQKRNGRPYGIFEILGPGNVKAVLIFVNKPSYEPRFNFYKVAENTVYAKFRKNFTNAMRMAIQTAR